VCCGFGVDAGCSNRSGLRVPNAVYFYCWERRGVTASFEVSFFSALQFSGSRKRGVDLQTEAGSDSLLNILLPFRQDGGTLESGKYFG
jgi:hypothetical protein